VTHRDTPSRRRRRHRWSKKEREIVENGVVLTAVALVVGLLIFVFNPQVADRSSSPAPVRIGLEP
jgi:hypothetical protein